MGRISGLDAFGLVKRDLPRLRSRHARIKIYLTGHPLTRKVLSMSPKLRWGYLNAQAARQRLAFMKRFPGFAQPLKDGGAPLERSIIPARVLVRDLSKIANAPTVQSVAILGIEGLRRRPAVAPLSWHCVRALVAIQVEGQKRGHQTLEDRFVIVKARSMTDAERRLKGKWREYAQPYLNSEGFAARWQLEKVVDVYELVEPDIDPAGTEVYSSLSGRRFKPKFGWNPQLRPPRVVPAVGR